jgi:hypothetical protein
VVKQKNGKRSYKYDDELEKLQLELVKLQEWIKNKGEQQQCPDSANCLFCALKQRNACSVFQYSWAKELCRSKSLLTLSGGVPHVENLARRFV